MCTRKFSQLVALVVPVLLSSSSAWAVFVPFNVFPAGVGPWLACPAAFIADGVQFATATYRLAPAGPFVCGNAQIQPPPGLGTGQALRLTNISIAPNIAAAVPGGITGMFSFDYVNLGGNVNLRVNGVLRVAPDFGAIAPGAFGAAFAVMVTPPIPGMARIVTILGPITNVRIGGTNLIIDNVTF